ncbi:MAG: S8 family serine peptidase [Alistipes sp.]|nr:S8 family serine peptidase [Alistipes sp.]
MNKGKILLISLAGLLAVSCVNDSVDQPAATPEVAVAKKFVNTSSDAVSGKLLFYVDEANVAQLESATSVTATGVEAIDAVAKQIGATGFHQVFNMKVNAELKRELGMDRWFAIEFPEDVNVDEAAKALAATSAVQRIEFPTLLVNPVVDEPEVVEVVNMGSTRAEGYPNDPQFNMQWALLNNGNANAPANEEYGYDYSEYTDPGFIFPTIKAGADINVVPAWEYTKGNAEVIVAIIDQGVDFNHEDLKDNMLANEAELNGQPGVDDDNNGYVDDVYGYNFIDNPANVKAEDVKPISYGIGHGTHVAGTVAATSNNGIGIAGVAGGSGAGDGVRMISCQILGGDNTSSDNSAAARAMEYAADRGAVIAQNSWGQDPGVITNDNTYKAAQSVRYAAFNYFMKKKNHPALDGGIIVFAAGNESTPMAGYPGAYNEYISVTSVAPDGLPAYYTNFGPGCNIAAPGGEYFVNQFGHAMRTGCVLSTLPDNKYGYMQGTSMATPHVSGVAALALSYAQDMGKCYTVNQFKEMLLTSVTDIDKYLYDGAVKYSTAGKMDLAQYRGKMGTGIIDTYRVLMAMRGISCVPAVAGEETVVDIKSLIADGQTSLKIMEEIIVPQDVRERLGLKNETIFGNDLIFTCTNTGTGVIKVVLVGGGEQIGGGNSMGGMRLEKEIAIIVREGYTLSEDGTIDGTNGWL